MTALFATACSRISAPGKNADSTEPTATAVHASVQDICSRFTSTALGSDTAIDQGPADARRRAAEQFGTPALINQLIGAGSDPIWSVLVAHHARVVVNTSPDDDDPLPATGNQASAAEVATSVALGADGWRQELPSNVVFCALANTDAGWKVAAVTFSDTTSNSATTARGASG